jgi:ribokinase
VSPVRAAVVGHVEWLHFARVEAVPTPGQIIHADEWWEEPAGGGGVAAVQMVKLAGACTLYTALGDDDLGHRADQGLREDHGVRVEAVFRRDPQRRAFAFLDRSGERTITVMGHRLGPNGADALPWDEMAVTDAVYFTAGDAGALRAARQAKVLVATSRLMALLDRAGVQLDAVVGSGRDESEVYRPIDPPPAYVVRTAGSKGGTYEGADGRTGSWAAAELPGSVVDAYGCGDSFAAGLAFGLGSGLDIDGALELAARCGAYCLTGKGPYGNQLTLAPGQG